MQKDVQGDRHAVVGKTQVCAKVNVAYVLTR